MKGKLHLTKLTVFHNVKTNSVGKDRGADVIYLKISKAFNRVSPKILIDKLKKYK